MGSNSSRTHANFCRNSVQGDNQTQRRYSVPCPDCRQKMLVQRHNKIGKKSDNEEYGKKIKKEINYFNRQSPRSDAMELRSGKKIFKAPRKLRKRRIKVCYHEKKRAYNKRNFHRDDLSHARYELMSCAQKSGGLKIKQEKNVEVEAVNPDGSIRHLSESNRASTSGLHRLSKFLSVKEENKEKKQNEMEIVNQDKFIQRLGNSSEDNTLSTNGSEKDGEILNENSEDGVKMSRAVTRLPAPIQLDCGRENEERIDNMLSLLPNHNDQERENSLRRLRKSRYTRRRSSDQTFSSNSQSNQPPSYASYIS